MNALKITKPNELNFICPCGLGDTMILCGVRAALELKYGSPIHFIIKPSHKVVMEMYGNTNYSIFEFTQEELKEISNIYPPSPTKGVLYVAHPLYSDPDDLIKFWLDGDLTQKQLFLRMLRIGENTEIIPPFKYPSLNSNMINSLDFSIPDIHKTILLVPEARSVKSIKFRYWKNLVRKLHNKGYFVVQNSIKKEYVIPGVPLLPDNLDFIIAFAIECHGVYSLRNGLCDLIANRVNNLTVFYPDTFTYKAYCLYGKNIKNVLVRDKFGEGRKILKRVIKWFIPDSVLQMRKRILQSY